MPIVRTHNLATPLPKRSVLPMQTNGEKEMSISRLMNQEPKELAQFATDAYKIGVEDCLVEIAMLINPDAAIINRIRENLQAHAFHAAEWRRQAVWIEGIDHSMSPSKTYVSMPIERYRELKALELDNGS